MRFPRRLGAALTGASTATVALTGIVLAATVVVTPGSGGWTEDDTRPSGDVRFTNDYGDPDSTNDGSVELSTGFGDTGAKAGLYNHSMFGTPIADVEALSYWTYQAVTDPPNPPHAAASYQLQVDVNGEAPAGFTTFVFEPYQNVDQGVLAPNIWQEWDVAAGLFWSTRVQTDPDALTCITTADAGGPPTYTLADIQERCPNAVVVGIGFNVGTFNPGWIVAVDLMQFNETTWDFELTNEPGSSAECKNGGWETLTDDEGAPFKNQGDCVSSVNSGKG